jgi:hypothetical protein
MAARPKATLATPNRTIGFEKPFAPFEKIRFAMKNSKFKFLFFAKVLK